MRRLVLLATLVLGLAVPAAARAATVRVDVDSSDDRAGTEQRLVFTAAPGEANRLVVGFSGSTFTVDDVVPLTLGANCRRAVASDPTKALCGVDAANSDATISLGDGDDTAQMPIGDAFSEIDAGPGNDVVHGDTVDGGPGDDQIWGRALTGGPGRDTETAVGDDAAAGAIFDEGSAANGNDVLIGGDGEDTVSYAGRTAPLRVDLAAGRGGQHGELDDLRSIEDVNGGKAGDRLAGTSGPNVIEGGRGADLLRGRGGDDRLYADSGNDTVDGGAGDDEVDGAAGNDLLVPGPGFDTVQGEGGNDRIRARDAAIDAVSCGTGRDRVTLNTLDFIAPGCDRRFRNGTPAAVPLGVSTFNQSDEIAALVGCPADLRRRCAGTVSVRLGRRTFVKRFHAKAGQVASVTLADSRDNPHYPAFAERVRITVRAADRHGTTRTVTRRLPAGIDE